MAGVRRELDRKQVCTDHVVDKPFLRSVRYLNQEIVATHQSRLEFFVQVIEKRQRKIISIFRFFVDTNLPTKRSIAMTSITKKQGEIAMKMKVDSSVADGKDVSLGGGKKPLNVKLNQSRSTADKKDVSLGGGKKPLNVKLNQSRSTADKKDVSLGGGKKPLNVKLNQSRSTADKKQVRIGGGRSPLRR